MTTPVQGYILCTAPRSGSTLLCHMLRATGVAGAPESLFHVSDIAAWRKSYACEDLADILRAARLEGRGTSAVFGMRLQHQSAAYLCAQLRAHFPETASDRAALEAGFGPLAFVYLNRPNKLDQAISYLKAEQTGLWHRAPSGSEIERLSPPAPAQYDAQALAQLITRFEQADADWRAWFAQNKITPIEITYPALAANPRSTLQDLLTALGLPSTPARHIDLPVAKLADKTSADWAEQFMAEKGYQTPPE